MKHSIKRNSGKFSTLTLILLAVCIFGRSSQAQTSIYIFEPNQSTIVQTGGFAGVNWTYTVEGQFQLTVDFEAGTASFDKVDANAVDDSQYRRTLDPNEVFAMTLLVGITTGDTTLEFTGFADDGSSILLEMTIVDDTVTIKAQTTPPPNSADFFIYNLDAVAHRKYAGGTGEPNNPYQIATAEDLILLGEIPEDYDKHFILTADIDLDPNLPAGKVFDKAIISPEHINYDSQASHRNPFSGFFDGQGYVIHNLNIQGQNYVGLFGLLSWDAEISNLGLEDVNISGRFSVGGLAGLSSANLSSCYVTGVINGASIVGGLVGCNNYGCISSCYNTSEVRVEGWDYFLGGLVGYNSGNISSSYSTGRIDGVGIHYVGGLVGLNNSYGIITASYSSGSLSGNDYVGGLVGSNGGSINASYSSVMILGNDKVGGLAGDNSGNISSSYSTGTVVGISDVGGLVGSLERTSTRTVGVVIDSFWDKESSGQDTSDGGTGLTTAQMQDPNTFITAGWDSIDETTNGIYDFWQFQEGTYPGLAVFSGIVPIEPDGAGIPEEPYLITNIDELLSIWYRPLAHYRLAADIDLSGITWNMAVVPWLGGSFDGNDFCIRSLHVQGRSFLGIFGILGHNAEVMNLVLEDVSIEGTGYQIGGLTGLNLGSVSSSYSSGTVSGDKEVGGLVGNNRGNISASHSYVEVSGNNRVGGLVGNNDDIGNITTSYSAGIVIGHKWVGGLAGGNLYSNITSSYSTSSVNGNEYVGGLVGYNWGNITMSYSSGAISGEEYIGGLAGYSLYVQDKIIKSCFWDIETSGIINMCGSDTSCDNSFGKTTAEMQTESTFTDAGWDFVGETANGTDDIWWIDEGQDYPRLWWEPIGE